MKNQFDKLLNFMIFMVSCLNQHPIPKQGEA